MAEEERRKEIEKIIIAVGYILLAESPAFRHQLIGMMADVFVRKEELSQVLEAIRELREDFNRRSEEHSRILQEYGKRLEEHSRILEGHSQSIKELIKRQDEHARRLEVAIGGLGARWGIMSEESFREGLKGILKGLGLKVERYLEYDTEGYVFGHPDQIELDVLVKDNMALLAEIKSSISKEEVYVFQRKVEFYEKKRGVKVERRCLLSPFIDPRARPIAKELGMEVYTSSYEAKI